MPRTSVSKVGTALLGPSAVLQQKLDVRHMGTVGQHTEMPERLCRWTGPGGRSSRGQTTLNHMWPSDPAASLKLTAGIALWCDRRALLEHSSQVRSGQGCGRQSMII